MTKENTLDMRRIYNRLLSMSIVLAGIGLIIACVGIYRSGDQAFSRESVAVAFAGIDIPVYLCLVLIAISFIWELLSPSGKEKTPIFKPYAAILSRLQQNRSLEQGDSATLNEIASLQKKRRQYEILRMAVIVISSMVFLVYACNSSNFHQSDINTSMIHAMMVLIPCFLVSFGVALFVCIANEKSLVKEIELMKQLPASSNKPNKTSAKKESMSAETASNEIPTVSAQQNKSLHLSRSVIITVAIVFIVYGFITGGTIDVLAKAINICTECIGLG